MRKSGDLAPFAARQVQRGGIDKCVLRCEGTRGSLFTIAYAPRPARRLGASCLVPVMRVALTFSTIIPREYSLLVLVSYSFAPSPLSSEAKLSPTAVTVPQNVSFRPPPVLEGSGRLFSQWKPGDSVSPSYLLSCEQEWRPNLVSALSSLPCQIPIADPRPSQTRGDGARIAYGSEQFHRPSEPCLVLLWGDRRSRCVSAQSSLCSIRSPINLFFSSDPLRTDLIAVASRALVLPHF